MDLEKELALAASTFVRMKRSMCRIEGGPCDLSPMLHFRYRHLNAYCGMMLSGDPIETVPESWRRILDDGVPEFVILMVEGYASLTKPENYERGSMERDFKENLDSDVFEIITLQGVEIKTGKQMTGVIPYRYGDDGIPVFDDPKFSECEGKSLEYNIPSVVKSCRDATVNFFEKSA